jgi:hypothetical protein
LVDAIARSTFCYFPWKNSHFDPPPLSHSLTPNHQCQCSYRQCLPSRFKKDLVKVIASDGIETLLKNIGASERITRTEIDTILSEAGSTDKKTVPANKMALLL